MNRLSICRNCKRKARWHVRFFCSECRNKKYVQEKYKFLKKIIKEDKIRKENKYMEEGTVPESVNATTLRKMEEAFNSMNKSVTKSRELSLAITNLEQAMMWFNKFRTISNEVAPYSTHVEKK